MKAQVFTIEVNYLFGPESDFDSNDNKPLENEEEIRSWIAEQVREGEFSILSSRVEILPDGE